MKRTALKSLAPWRENNLWMVEAQDLRTGETSLYQSKALVNAAGPWV